jgi:ankyrin repeat protein
VHQLTDDKFISILTRANINLSNQKDKPHGHLCWDKSYYQVPAFLENEELVVEEEAIQTQNKHRKTSLSHRSAQNNNYILYCVLSLVGASFEAKNVEGNSVYQEFLKNLNNNSRNFNEVNSFLKWWVLKVTDQHWLKVFRMAAEEQYENCLNILIENKSNVNVWSKEDGNTALHLASKANFPEAAHKLISKNADVNCSNFNGNTPLHLATENGNIDCLKFLIENSADVNAKNFRGLSPLHFAAETGQIDCMSFLICNNADINAKNSEEVTPLHFAAKHGSIGCLKLLIDKSADVIVNAKNTYGETALHYAAQWGQLECLKLLIEKGRNVNEENESQQKPLHYAYFIAREETTEITKVLLEAGAEVNAKDKYDGTPLHGAVNSELPDEAKENCCKMLIEAGADVLAKNDDGKTSMAYDFLKKMKEKRPELFSI